jgi:hydrogenase 3 maturation protease
MTIPTEILLFCIGNRQGGDDAIGPYIFDRLQKEKTGTIAVDCGIAPENYTGFVKQHKPHTLLFIDAVDMGLPPGEIRIVPKEKLGSMHISTHGIPLSVMIKYLNHEVECILVIGIQPEHMSGTISKVVKESGEHLIDILKKKKLKQIPIL